MKNEFEVRIEFADLKFYNKNCTTENRYGHQVIYDKVIEFIKSRNFEFKTGKYGSPEGRKKNLKASFSIYPAGFEIDFYHESDGCYSSSRYEKMPYLIKKMVINESQKIADFLRKQNIKDITKIKIKAVTSEEKIKREYVECWHHDQTDMNFDLKDFDGKTNSYTNSNQEDKDRDGKILRNGQIKYFRDYYGRLNKGKIYHATNSNWYLILNEKRYAVRWCTYLFDATADDFKQRRKKEIRLSDKKKDEIETKRNPELKKLKKAIKKYEMKNIETEFFGINVLKAFKELEKFKSILNPENIKFLKELSEKLKTQENFGTARPLVFQILDFETSAVYWDDDADYIAVLHDGEEFGKYENTDGGFNEFLEEYKEYYGLDDEDEEYDKTTDIPDYFDEIKNLDGFDTVCCTEKQVFKNFFLTKEEAERHLKNNRGKYNEKARVACNYGGYSHELTKLLEIIEKF